MGNFRLNVNQFMLFYFNILMKEVLNYFTCFNKYLEYNEAVGVSSLYLSKELKMNHN